MAALKAAVKDGRAEIFIDAACEAELVRVLAYDLGRHSIDAQKQAACVADCRRISNRLEKTIEVGTLPRCPDPKDQIFLEAAAAAKADYLVTKDRDLLDMARRRLPFRVVQPQFFEA